MTDASGRHRTVAHAAPTCHDPEENLAMHMARKLDAFEWTLEELHRLPDDGNKYELVRGEVFVTPGRGRSYGFGEARSSRMSWCGRGPST